MNLSNVRYFERAKILLIAILSFQNLKKKFFFASAKNRKNKNTFKFFSFKVFIFKYNYLYSSVLQVKNLKELVFQLENSKQVTDNYELNVMRRKRTKSTLT